MVQPVGMEPQPYEDFRCGASFAAARAELTDQQRQAREAGLYMFVTRKTVLGRMRQMKSETYAEYMRWHLRAAV